MTKTEYWLMKCQQALDKAAKSSHAETLGWYIAAECFAVAYRKVSQ